MKSVKKKHFAGRESEDFELEEDFSAKDANLELDFLDVKDIEAHITKLENFKNCPEDLVVELASEMYRWVEMST